MKFKQFLNKVNSSWHSGNIQRTSRITYDVAWNIILFFIIVGTLSVLFATGVGAGYFASLVKEEPIRDYEEMQRDIYNYEETSKLYFANKKYIGDIRADLHREEVKLDKVADTVKDAVIATEDQLFYEHSGVVPKAIMRAIFQEVANADTKTGGSTLTQQLIKNQILTNEVSFERKAKEILLAMRLENFFEKDEILEAYLNIVPYGRDASGQNVAGIQTAAKGVFGVNASKLSLPQAAFLAGIPQNPYAFTPFDQSGNIKDEAGLQRGIDRMHLVLKRMYQAGYITEKEYKKALEYDITKDFAKKAPSSLDKYPAVVLELEKQAKDIITELLVEEDGYSLEEIKSNEELEEQYNILADRALRMNGYKIHSTIDKDMYDKMQEVVKNYPYFGPDRTFTREGETKPTTEPIEVGASVIENGTGKVLAFVPGRKDSLDNQYNHATQAYRSPGSTIKPLIVYGPAMEMGALQPGSVVADTYISGSYSPKNISGTYYGLVSAREALRLSHNVSAVKIYQSIIDNNPAEKYLGKMGIESSAYEGTGPALALGGTRKGITVEQNVNAFATFGNKGEYVPSYMIEKITDSEGKVIYEHETEKERVFSPQTAYLTIDMMRDVIRSGSGSYLQGKLKHSSVDWAGKTGTSQEYKDAWFVGTNPNVTVGLWIGYDTPSSLNCTSCTLSYSQQNQQLWAQLVNELSDLNPDKMVPSERHTQPDGITTRSYCATSGLLPSELCSKAGLVNSDIYNAKYVPTKTDDSLVGGNMTLVEVDGNQIPASSKTPKEFTVTGKGGFAFDPNFLKRMGYNDPAALIPRLESSRWSKISPSAGKASGSGSSIEDNGQSPSTPSGVSASSSKLSWNAKNGDLIVGYRVYRANDEKGSFKLLGSTKGTTISIPSGGGAYQVKAVNYFGRESSASKSVVVKGNKKDKENKEKEKDKKEKDTEKKQEKDKQQKEKKDESKKQDKQAPKKDKEDTEKKKESNKKQEENKE